MGIDVWYKRTGETAAPAPVKPLAEPSKPVPEPVPAAPAVETAPPEDAPRVVAVEVERFELLCVRAPNALLFTGALASAAHQRLAQDIALSVSLAMQREPGNTEWLSFRYPQVSGSDGDWQRPLRAFTSKQLGLIEPGLVLVSGSAAQRFEGWLEPAPLLFADFDTLARDATLKAQLWREIRSRCS